MGQAQFHNYTSCSYARLRKKINGSASWSHVASGIHFPTSNPTKITKSHEGSTGTSLLFQWLRLWVFSAGGPGLIPGQGTRCYMLQLNIPYAATKTHCSQTNKYKQVILFKKKTVTQVQFTYPESSCLLCVFSITVADQRWHYIWGISNAIVYQQGRRTQFWRAGPEVRGGQSCKLRRKDYQTVHIFSGPWFSNKLHYSTPTTIIFYICITILVQISWRFFKKALLVGFPGAYQCRRHRFDSWSRMIPQAIKQLSSCTATFESVL